METADYTTKLSIRKCYHNFLHVYMPNKQKQSTNAFATSGGTNIWSGPWTTTVIAMSEKKDLEAADKDDLGSKVFIKELDITPDENMSSRVMVVSLSCVRNVP